MGPHDILAIVQGGKPFVRENKIRINDLADAQVTFDELTKIKLRLFGHALHQRVAQLIFGIDLGVQITRGHRV